MLSSSCKKSWWDFQRNVEMKRRRYCFDLSPKSLDQQSLVSFFLERIALDLVSKSQFFLSICHYTGRTLPSDNMISLKIKDGCAIALIGEEKKVSRFSFRRSLWNGKRYSVLEICHDIENGLRFILQFTLPEEAKLLAQYLCIKEICLHFFLGNLPWKGENKFTVCIGQSFPVNWLPINVT